MTTYSVAYLDLLGFRHFAKSNTAAAADVLMAYQAQVDLKRHFPDKSGPDEEKYKKLIDKWRVTSFRYFLPFSDSIFILSNQPDLFALQISTFILSSFLFHAHGIDDRSRVNPEEVAVRVLDIDRHGHPSFRTTTRTRFPVLFRGGITHGEAAIGHQGIIDDHKDATHLTTLGPAIVEAVSIQETVGHGPFLHCDKAFYDQLQSDFSNFVTKEGDRYNILYPAVHYYGEPDDDIALNGLQEILHPAIRYWMHYNHTAQAEHYFALLKLIVDGTLVYFQTKGRRDKAEKKIREALDHQGIGDKCNALLG